MGQLLATHPSLLGSASHPAHVGLSKPQGECRAGGVQETGPLLPLPLHPRPSPSPGLAFTPGPYPSFRPQPPPSCLEVETDKVPSETNITSLNCWNTKTITDSLRAWSSVEGFQETALALGFLPVQIRETFTVPHSQERCPNARFCSRHRKERRQDCRHEEDADKERTEPVCRVTASGRTGPPRSPGPHRAGSSTM